MLSFLIRTFGHIKISPCNIKLTFVLILLPMGGGGGAVVKFKAVIQKPLQILS